MILKTKPNKKKGVGGSKWRYLKWGVDFWVIRLGVCLDTVYLLKTENWKLIAKNAVAK